MRNPEPEVELDSLGSFFVHLIDNDYYQDEAEGSHAEDVEVTILSSDSDPLPTSKIRQANQKVKFSHPVGDITTGRKPARRGRVNPISSSSVSEVHEDRR